MTENTDGADDRRAERLATIGELAAGIAHEINNPVAYVRSNLDSLDEYVRDLLTLMRLYEHSEPEMTATGAGAVSARLSDARQRIDYHAITEDLPTLIDDCRTGMELVASIVGALRDFARDTDEASVPSDLNALARRALVLATNSLKHRAEITTQFDSLPLVTCHPGRLTQVVLNLLVNAGDAMTDEGEILLRTRQEGRSVIVEIADTGEGIPDALREKVFQPFFTTKREQRGTGMGLAIAREIVHGSGGTLAVVPLAGYSTCFRITFPLDADNASPTPAQSA